MGVIKANEERIKGDDVFVLGRMNEITGDNVVVVGSHNIIYGNNARVYGKDNIVHGTNARVEGNGTYVYGDNAKVCGIDCHIYGVSSVHIEEEIDESRMDCIMKADFGERPGKTAKCMDKPLPQLRGGVANVEQLSAREPNQSPQPRVLQFGDGLIPRPGEELSMLRDFMELQQIYVNIQRNFVQILQQQEAKEIESSPKHWSQVLDPSRDVVYKSEPGKEDLSCVICFINNRKAVLVPCGHAHTCIGCAIHLHDLPGETLCPTCRDPVTSAIEFFG